MIYDRFPRIYDVVGELGERQLREAGLRLLEARPTERVLEIGCGAGRATLDLARGVGPTGSVVGVDLSAAMLGLARERLARGGLASQVGLLRADARCLPFEPSVFDAIFTSFTLELFDDLAIGQVLADCRRCLRPSGRLGVVALSARGRASPVRRLYEWSHRRWPMAIDCRPIDVEGCLVAAGFALVESAEVTTWGLPTTLALARPADR